LNVFKSPFEKLSKSYLGQISDNTAVTASALTPGGDLFSKVDEMVKYLKIIAKEKTGASLKDATLLRLIGGKTFKGIGEGFQLIAEALRDMPAAKESREKMAVIVTGIQAISNIGNAILKFAASLALSVPLLIIGVLGLPLLALSIIVLGKVFSLLNKMGVSESMKSTGEGLAMAGLGIIAVGASLALFAIILPPTAENFLALALASLVITTIGVVFYFLDKMGIVNNIKKTSVGLIVAAGAILALGASISLFALMLPPDTESFQSLLMVGTTIIGVGLAMALVGNFAGKIALGSLAMILTSIPIILLGIGVSIFSKAVEPNEKGWISIGQISALVVGLGAAMALAGFAAVFIIPGAIAMLVAGVALISIAAGVKAISKVFGNSSIDKMLEDSGEVTEGFLGFGGGRMMSKLEWLMLSIARSFTLPPSVLVGMYAAMPVMLGSGLALLSIAKGIEKVQALDIDYEIFPGQVSTLVNTLAAVFGEIGVKYPGGGGGMLSAILGSSNGDSAVAQGISAVGGMGRALTSIAIGVQHMSKLSFPIKWDKNGNPIEFQKLKNEDFVNLGINTRLIVDALGKTFGEIGSDEKMGKGGRKGFLDRVFGGGNQSPVADGISSVMGMGEAIGSIAKGVQSMADLKFPIYGPDGKITGYETIGDIDDIKTRLTDNTQKLILALTGVFGKIGEDPNAEDKWGWFGHSNIEEGIQLVTDIADPIIKIAKTAESISKMNFDTESITKKIELLLLSLTGNFGAIGSAVMAVSIGGMWEKTGTGVEKVGKGMGTIAKGINSMDMKKLVETRQMFEALAVLSKHGPADVFNKMSESLKDALENLAELLTEFKQEVKNSNQTSTGMLGALSNIKDMVLGNTNINNTNDKNDKISDKSNTVKQIEPIKQEMTKFNSADIVDAIEELQRIIKSQKTFI
jgi:hypothetical protein